MSKRLRLLLVAVGTVLAGALTMPLFRAVDGVTTMQLADGGILECTPADMICDVRLPDDMAAKLADAGRSNGRKYHRLAIDVAQCGDAGVIITDRFLYKDGGWLPGLSVIDGTCSVYADAGVAGDAIVRTVPSPCACRKATGNCRYLLPDGGQPNLPFGVTGGPPTLLGGGGCLPKSCVTIAGTSDESWPGDCPQ
jgi:hypothetical protein